MNRHRDPWPPRDSAAAKRARMHIVRDDEPQPFSGEQARRFAMALLVSAAAWFVAAQVFA